MLGAYCCILLPWLLQRPGMAANAQPAPPCPARCCRGCCCTATLHAPSLLLAARHSRLPGASHLLEYMAFKTTKNRTHLRLVREVEAIGGNVLASGACAAGGLAGGTLANDVALLLLLLYSKQRSRV